MKKASAKIVAKYRAMPPGAEREKFRERHIKVLSESAPLREDVNAGLIRLKLRFRELGWFDPDRSEYDDDLRTLAGKRLRQMKAVRSGDEETAATERDECARMAGEISEKFARLEQFARIGEVAEALRDPYDYLDQKEVRKAFLDVGKALGDFIEAHGHPPKSQRELVNPSGRSKDTVSKALRWLRVDLLGTPGRKRG